MSGRDKEREIMDILVLNGSPRPNGNTAALVCAFAGGAREAGHAVEVIDVAALDIAGCKGCEFCHTRGDGACVQRDDMGQVYARWNEADMLVLASPVYYGSFSGQLHCAIHRTYALGVPERARKMALILSSGAADVYAASERIYHGFIQGYFGAEDCGVFTAAGAENRSSAKLEELRAFGRSL